MIEIHNGLDVVEIGRIARAMENPRFISRFFSPREQAIFAKKKDAAPTVAAHFAAKEAFSKAIGTGVRFFALREVEVLRDHKGAPFLAFGEEAQAVIAPMGYRFSVSLTHTRDYAAAVVTAYGNVPDEIPGSIPAGHFETD